MIRYDVDGGDEIRAFECCELCGRERPLTLEQETALQLAIERGDAEDAHACGRCTVRLVLGALGAALWRRWRQLVR